MEQRDSQCANEVSQRNLLSIIIVINVMVVLTLLSAPLTHWLDISVMTTYISCILLVFIGYLYTSTNILQVAHIMVVVLVVLPPFLIQSQALAFMYSASVFIHILWFIYNKWRCPMSEVRFYDTQKHPTALTIDLPPKLQITYQILLIIIVWIRTRRI
jgi:hypothetical protein